MKKLFVLVAVMTVAGVAGAEDSQGGEAADTLRSRLGTVFSNLTCTVENRSSDEVKIRGVRYSWSVPGTEYRPELLVPCIGETCALAPGKKRTYWGPLYPTFYLQGADCQAELP